MASYVVMEPPAATADEASMRAVMVRDGFSIIAFLVPLVWLLWHRLWIEAILLFAASVAVMAAGQALDHAWLGGVLSFVLSVYFGLEGAALRIGAFSRRGWREWGAVEAGNAAEAEIRYLAGEDDGLPVAAPLSPVTTSGVGRPAAVGPALGLLGYPGRH
jgi:hypothetical protein